ncbi:MAG TPA: tetratricopeptide repeat protein, partial [Bacteroidetes bacterium]|nr:tetratricopeptide repeat protein [Bacteroidota bacterium]
MAKFFLSIAFLLVTISSFAQTDVDSLKNLLVKQADETAKMHIKLELGDAYSKVSADSALFWYSQVFPEELYGENAFTEWLLNAQQSSIYYLSVALSRAGQIKLNSEDASEGLSWLEKAFYLADSINQPELAVHCSDIIAVYFAQTNQPELAIDQFNKSLVIYNSISNAKGVAYCLGNLAVVNAGVGNLAESAKQFDELILFKRQNNISSGLIDDYINAATLYYKLDDIRKSEENWLKAYDLAKSLVQNGYIEDVLLGLGEFYINIDQTETALQYYKELYSYLSDEQQAGNALLIAANSIAAILYEQDKLNEALPYWEKTYSLGMAMENVQAEADALLSLSNIHFHLGNHDKGSEYQQKYIEHSKQFASSEAVANSYIAMAEVLEGQNELEKALQQYANALALYQAKGDLTNEALANISVASLFVKQQKYQSALDFYNANLSSENDLPSAVVAASYQGKADVLRLQLQYVSALQWYDKALAIWTSIENYKQAIVCLNSMGTLFETTGNLPESVRRYEQALSIAVKIGNNDAIAAISNNLGVVYRKLGDYPKALDAYEEALRVYLETDNSIEASYCYNNIGIVYENQGDYTNASIYYEKSLSIKQDFGDKQGLATSYMNMGNVYKFSDNSTKAEDYYNQALSISTEIGDRQGEALACGSLAALKLEGKNYHEAISY